MSIPILPVDPVPRLMQSVAEERLRAFPVLTITGPRQSGKTTLARLLRPEARYFSLEDPDIQAFASEDPRGFLADAGDVAILDEVQRVPDLLSYLQGVEDAGRKPGRFILAGSIQFELIESVTQSLAGRTALLNIRDVAAFQRFVQLCAGRCGQLLNLNSLAENAGINRATAQTWMLSLSMGSISS